ncbi:MAG: N-acetylmuramic acid 6-phosphate etherase [Actinomycetes bacterium]
MSFDEELAALRTEQVDEKFAMLDVMSVSELLQVMNESDAEVPKAIADVIPIIKTAIDGIVDRMLQGGRLVYLGAGTSGRLGVLDAAELGPTFSVAPTEVLAFIAGGEGALRHAVESAEDNSEAGVIELQEIDLTSQDCVVGIAASGRTPYVIGALKYANEVGSLTIGLTSNPSSDISKIAQIAIDVDTGPELLAGSTRLKSGTAQKLVLNMISTITMIRLGKTFGNLMVDLQITNEKLQKRAVRIIQNATAATPAEAETALKESGNRVKIAILMLLLHINADESAERLKNASNHIRAALETHL